MTNEFFDKNSLFQSKEKIPKKYFELIEKCSSEDPNKRPSFEIIVRQLKNKYDFIVDGVDQQEFDRYKNLLKHSKFQNDVNQLNHLISSKIQKIAKKTYLDINKYKIVEIIAKGIYSNIYKIKENETGKFFSAKIYNDKSINNSEKLEQQFKEIKLLTKLNHPSIMKYIGYSPINFDSKLALTVVIETGQILENVIQSKQNGETTTGWNSTKKLINIYGIASAMKYLHSLGIIHKNLRCGNIIEDENFYPNICSFSFFKYLYELNDKYQENYFFNPAGSAPEVLENQIYSKESDVCSFAFVVYEIMTNDVPYPEFKNPLDFYRGVVSNNQRGRINNKQEEKPVLITELLTRGTLEDILEMERIGYPHLEWNETKKLINIYGIASTMKHLHSKSYIHRDLKPQTILLDKNLYPKLSDFGLSKLYSSDNNENTKMALGTPVYMAPEIWNSYDYTKAVDIYAFSLIVYEIITNVKPFDGMNIYLICYKITKNYRPEIKDDVPDCYKTLIEKCWDQDQSKRPSFDEIAELIKNDPDFKNEKVDINEFNRYVEFVEKEFEFNEHLMNEPDTNLANKNEFVINLLNQEIEKEVKKSSSNKIIIDLDDYEQREILKKDLFNKFFKVIQKDTGQFYTARLADVELNQFKKEEITQFIKDLNKLLLLNHPAIIKLIGFSPFNFKKEFKPVFINELSPKLTLNDIFKNEKKKLIIPGWNSTKKLINMYGIASAMKYLHSLDIIHQNLKPDNIFVDEYFYPKLSEIGFFTHKLIIHSMTLQSASKVPQSAVIYSAPEVLFNFEDPC